MKINRDNLKWAGRMALILVLVGATDALVVYFARKPFPWVVVIPALTPFITCVWVIIPMMKAEKFVPPNA